MAKGYMQTYGIDYQETFAPVAKMNSVRVLISLVASQKWPSYQFDVKNAFLDGDLDEEVFMKPPPSFQNVGAKGKVCKLRKALYSLKQSPRAWFKRFRLSMVNNGYTQCQSDHTLFVKHDKNKVTALIVYVDDIMTTSNDAEAIKILKSQLAKDFEIKDLVHPSIS